MTTHDATPSLDPSNNTNRATRKAQILTLIAAFLGWMFDGLEMGIFPLIARPALMEMNTEILDPKALEGYVQFWNGIITAAFLFGAAFGGLVFGWLGDRIGRVKAMTASILCYSIFTGLVYFAQAPWQMASLRFIAALGMGGEWSLGVALVMEIWPAKYRPLMAGIIGAAANVGFLLVGLIGMIWPVSADNWRWMLLLGAAPAFLTFFIRLFVPESERWKEAVQGRNVKPVREILARPLLKRTILATLFASIPLIGTWGIVQWIPLWTDQIAGPENPGAKAVSTFVLAFAAILGCLAAPLLGQKIGRRPAYFTFCLLTILAAYFLYQVAGPRGYGPMFHVATFLISFVATSFFGWLPLYLPELFPTRVRATAQGLAFNAGRVLSAVANWNMGAIMAMFDNSYARVGMVISMIYLVGMAVIWLAPETKGKPLPE